MLNITFYVLVSLNKKKIHFIFNAQTDTRTAHVGAPCWLSVELFQQTLRFPLTFIASVFCLFMIISIDTWTISHQTIIFHQLIWINQKMCSLPIKNAEGEQFYFMFISQHLTFKIPQITITEAKDSYNFTSLHSFFCSQQFNCHPVSSVFKWMSHFGVKRDICTTCVNYECTLGNLSHSYPQKLISAVLQWTFTEPSEEWTRFVPLCKVIKEKYTIWLLFCVLTFLIHNWLCYSTFSPRKLHRTINEPSGFFLSHVVYLQLHR